MRNSGGLTDRSSPVALIAGVILAVGLLLRGLVVEKGVSAPDISAVFPPGPWQWLLVAGGVGVSFQVVFSLFHALSGRRVRQGEVSSARVQSTVAQAVREAREGVESSLQGKTPDLPLALDELLRGALICGASDIHLNPGPQALSARYRVDGVIHAVCEVQGRFAAQMVSRVKVLSHLDPNALTPQDGSLRRLVGDVDIEARVSTLPANHGDRVVLRLVRSSTSVPTIDELGFPSAVADRLRALLTKPEGMVYVSGPVGSGKTTTLYSALQEVYLERGDMTSLVSLEDPIEMQLPFVTQTQMNPKTGLGFATALRSVLRQDPGAIMLGEVRDKETAHIATQAGLTGHLILTTLHVKSAAATFERLIELEVDRFVVASSCLGCVAQRLVRTLCPACKKKGTASASQVARLQELGCGVKGAEFYCSQGCSSCGGSGFAGRAPVLELLVMSESIREAIQRSASRVEIERLAQSEGMVSILESAFELARKGKTSVSEVLRVAG